MLKLINWYNIISIHHPPS